MSTLEEKRVYGDRSGSTEVYVASSTGIVRVSVAGDTVGEFGLVHRCSARDIATSDGVLAVSTDEDVLILEGSDGEQNDEQFRDTGFGPATAVGVDGGTVLAADQTGRIFRRQRTDEWQELASPASVSDVRAIDRDLIATAEGVFRVDTDELVAVGLEDVRDVSTAGVPLAATRNGLYRLGAGWQRVHEGEFDVVGAAPSNQGAGLGRAHAVSGHTVYEHDDGTWTELSSSTLPPTDAPIVDLAYGDSVYAVTQNGTVLVEGGDGWRSRTIGVHDIGGIATITRGSA